MPDVMAVLSRWWKFIAGTTVAATLLAALVSMLLPKRFHAVATALPASRLATDKGAIFNTNIQQLYSPLGTPDDLDAIIGTAQLDTLYIATVSDLNLVAHYGLKTGADGTERAVRRLKKNTMVTKSEWGELRVQETDANSQYAAHIANRFLEKLQLLHQALQNKSNTLVLQRLQALQQPTDTANNQPTNAMEAARYAALLTEYQLMVATNPPALLVVENARPPLYADTKTVWATILFTAFAAAFFTVLLSLYTEGNKTRS